MRFLVTTCRICASSYRVEFDPPLVCHGLDNWVAEELDMSAHVARDDCEDRHCEWHQVDESAVGAYRICGECGHVFKTPAALIQAYELVGRRSRRHVVGAVDDYPLHGIAASTIEDCPLCGHTF